MKFLYAFPPQLPHLLDRNRGSDELARFGIVFEAVEPVDQPGRNACPATRCKTG